MKKYNPLLLKEDFAIGSEVHVLEKVCSILSKRVGSKISVSKVPVGRNTDIGHIEGIQAFLSDGRRLRFDFKIGNSSKVIAIHFWSGFHIQPDLTMPTDDKNIIQILDAITEVLKSGQPEEFILTEDVITISKTQGKVSKGIADAINQWASDMDFGEHDLQNRRMKELYNSFRYWKTEVPASSDFIDVSESAFRDYIIQYLAKYNLTNIFMRKIKVFKAGKEISIDTDESVSKKFDKEIMQMSLDDQIDFIKIMTRAVAQGKKNSLIICGTPGTGKSRTVKEIVNAEKGSRKVIEDSGLIGKVGDLYRFLYQHRDKENIILFDDTKIIEEKAFRPFLLQILSPDHKRILTNRGEKYVDPDSLASLNRKSIPDSFEFEASVIVITNVMKKRMDSAIVSRTTPIELDVSKNSIVDSIRVNLHKIVSEYKDFSEVTIGEASKLIDFIEENINTIDRIDFRLFKECLSMVCTLPPSNMWKRYVLMLLKDFR